MPAAIRETRAAIDNGIQWIKEQVYSQRVFLGILKEKGSDCGSLSLLQFSPVPDKQVMKIDEIHVCVYIYINHPKIFRIEIAKAKLHNAKRFHP